MWLIIMLGLPCLAYLVVVGYQNRSLVEKDVVAALRDVVAARADLFSVSARQTQHVMELMADWLPWYQITVSENSPLRHEAMDLLNDCDTSIDILWCAYAPAEGSRFKILLTTAEVWQGTYVDQLISGPLNKPGSNIQIIDLPFGTKGQLLTQSVPAANGQGVAGILLTVLDLRYVLAATAAKPLLAFPIEMALLDGEGDVLETSQVSWGSFRFTNRPTAPRGPITMRLTPSSKYPDTEQFTWQGDPWTAALWTIVPGQLQVMAAVQMDQALAPSKLRNQLGVAVGIIVVALGAAIAVAWSQRLIRPLTRLAYQMNQVRAGNWSVRYVDEPSGYELNDLGHGVNRTLEILKKSTQEAAEAEATTTAIKKEWAVAQEVQHRTLPEVIPQVPGLDLAAFYRPAKEVAGDLYDLILRQSDGQELFIALADVCGKGIGACLHSLTLRGALRSAFHSTQGLSDIVIYANKLFARDTAATAMFATLSAALYHPETRQLSFTSCGHTPGLLIHADGQLTRLQTPGMALGVVEELPVEVLQVDLREGDLVVLYSDGISEAHDQESRLFGETRLMEVAMQYRSLSAQQVVDRVIQAVTEFQGSAVQHDDITMVVVKAVRGPS